MVELDMKPLENIISKKVKIGNDKRQFILRIPIKISDNSILKDFKKEYSADVEIDIKKPDKILVRLKND